MRFAMFASMAAALATASCQQPHPRVNYLPPEDTSIRTCTAPEGTLRVVTINGGLAQGVISMTTARTPDFAKDVAQFRDADVLCLQEVWKEDAVAAVWNALGLPPENMYREDTRGQNEEPGRFTCGEHQLDGVVECVKEGCGGWSKEDQTICALRECRSSLISIAISDRMPWGTNCANCLAASVGNPVEDIVRTCSRKSRAEEKKHPTAGASRVFGGANGVFLASRHPIKNRAFLKLRASARNAVVLFADIDIPGWGLVPVACTHMSSPEAGFKPTYPGIKSWDQELTGQFLTIAAALKARAGNRPMLLIGDLNTGVTIEPNGSLTYEPVWDVVLSEGFEDPVSRVRPPMCTMCSTNALRNGGIPRIIDHVLTLSPPGTKPFTPVCGRQLLTGRRPYKRIDGSTVEIEVSDHYGVEIDFK